MKYILCFTIYIKLEKAFILRHDVDSVLPETLKMFELERNKGCDGHILFSILYI